VREESGGGRSVGQRNPSDEWVEARLRGDRLLDQGSYVAARQAQCDANAFAPPDPSTWSVVPECTVFDVRGSLSDGLSGLTNALARNDWVVHTVAPVLDGAASRLRLATYAQRLVREVARLYGAKG